ncbi:MAG: hypothetical protein J7521_23020 [Caulobacter sp.]|nr:hypothetical protein [Caulobacter sp.]
MADTPPDDRRSKLEPKETDRPGESAADLQRGVRRQREHIKELTGEDPLRGGVAD